MELLQKLSKKELVKRLQQLKYKKKVIYDACQYRKQVKSSFKAKNHVSTN
jgi:uncharacterized protein (DUF1919 family)